MVKKNKKGGSTIWNYNENISDNSVIISCHGINLGYLVKLPKDIKIITLNKCGERKIILADSKYTLLSNYLSKISDLPSTGIMTSGKKIDNIHIYQNGDLIPEIGLSFININRNANNKETNLREGFGIVGISEEIQEIFEEINDSKSIEDYWYHSDFLEKKNSEKYDELKKKCIGNKVLLSEILILLYEMGIRHFILDVCRNWNTNKNASNKYRVEYTKQNRYPNFNPNKFNLNKLNEIENALLKSIKEENKNLKRTFSGIRHSNNLEEVIETSNFLKNNSLDDWEKISLNELVLKYSKKKKYNKRNR